MGLEGRNEIIGGDLLTDYPIEKGKDVLLMGEDCLIVGEFGILLEEGDRSIKHN